jgi:hypothetical protein
MYLDRKNDKVQGAPAYIQRVHVLSTRHGNAEAEVEVKDFVRWRHLDGNKQNDHRTTSPQFPSSSITPFVRLLG